MPFDATFWNDGGPPDINAANLNTREAALAAYTDGKPTVVVTHPSDPSPDPTAYPTGTIWIRSAS